MDSSIINQSSDFELSSSEVIDLSYVQPEASQSSFLDILHGLIAEKFKITLNDINLVLNMSEEMKSDNDCRSGFLLQIPSISVESEEVQSKKIKYSVDIS